MKIFMTLLLVNQIMISKCQKAIPITNKCSNYAPPSNGYHIKPDANCIIHECMWGCLICKSQNTCDQCQPGTVFYSGVLFSETKPVGNQYYRCISEFEKNILLNMKLNI